MRTKEIAVFGGSFDPPTVVHEQIVRALLNDPSFDEVWIMPSGNREDKPQTSEIHKRLAMLAILCQEKFAAEERLHISEFELGLPQPTETFCTYEELGKQYPSTRFWFVFGADSVTTMHTWREGERLLDELPMIVVPRHGYEVPASANHVQELPDLELFKQAISSTEVRRRVGEGVALDGLVTDAIAGFIHRRRLYRQMA